ncbi:MAG TPA: AraC family transcriptional regulator [Puia sp.]|nr:AraC family transcriptional regulator [Puia sp.]
MTLPIKVIESFPDPAAGKYDENRWYRQHDNAIVIINCQSKNIFYPRHWTPLSVKCAFQGTEHYHFEKHAFGVSDKSFLILNEGSEYRSSIRSETLTHSFSINFTARNITDVYGGIFSHGNRQLDDPFNNYDGSPRFVEKLYPHDGTFPRLPAIRKLVQQKGVDQACLLEQIYFVLGDMILLYNQTSAEIDELKAKKRATREELYKRLYKAKDFMDSCYQADVSLQTLAEISLLNSFYLLRQFKNVFKVTPRQYLIKRRLSKATDLLLTTDLPIDVIRDQVGFSDISSFCKLFKRVYRYPPGIFREKARR